MLTEQNWAGPLSFEGKAPLRPKHRRDSGKPVEFRRCAAAVKARRPTSFRPEQDKMTQEQLACNPRRWRAVRNEAAVAADILFYLAEHGYPPEILGEKGLFLIGYHYLFNPEDNTIFPLNPLTGTPYPRDAREMFNLEGFNRLVNQLFPGSLFLWISPADPNLNYFYPRIYLGKVEENPQKEGSYLIEAIDFNNDFSLEELRAILKDFSPQKEAKTPEDFRRQPIVIPPSSGLKNIGDLLDRIEKIISQKRKEDEVIIHRIPFAVIKEQWQKRSWEKVVTQFRTLAQKTAEQISPKIEEGDFNGALWSLAQLEQIVAAQGGFFAPQSSCGAAITSLRGEKFFLGIPSSFIFLSSSTQEKGGRCPVCGHYLTRPVAVGQPCPYCGTIRRC